jgi:hypothetical protein
MDSDHCAVKFEIVSNKRILLENPSLIPSFKNANWEKYRSFISKKLSSDIYQNANIENIHSTNQIDEIVDDFTEMLTQAQKQSVPMVHPDHYAVVLSPEIEDAIRARNWLKRRWQRLRDPHLKYLINYFNKYIRQKILELENMNWNHRLENVENNNDLWKFTKLVKSKHNILPPLKINDKVLLSPAEKTNAFADHFEQCHQNPQESKQPKLTNRIENYVNEVLENLPNNLDADYPCPEETNYYIRNLKKSKAPGLDRIHNSMLKQLPWTAVIYVNFIICCCIKLCYFPEKWKTANVVAIKKPGKSPSSVDSYRPISLLSTLSKILERVILKRLQNHLDSNDIIPKEQCGFTKGRSTNHLLSKIVSHIKNKFNINCSSTGMILLDIEKAFDRVWHYGLLYKLIKFRFPPYLIKFTRSLLENRSFKVTYKTISSSLRKFKFGLPQGGVTSPTYYNIYTADIPKHPSCHIGLFADDTAIYSTSPHFQTIYDNLQDYLAELEIFFKRWKIRINGEKTKAMYFTRRRKKELPNKRIKVSGAEIEWSKEIKYLGLILDKTLTFKKHVDYAINKMQNCVRILFPLLNRRSKLNVSNKLLIFKQILRPVLTYGCPAFHNMAKTHFTRMQIAQNKAIKLALNVPWRTSTKLIHTSSKIEEITKFTQRLYDKFIQRAETA